MAIKAPPTSACIGRHVITPLACHGVISAGEPETISAGWAPHKACQEPIPRMSATTPHPVAPNLFLTRSSRECGVLVAHHLVAGNFGTWVCSFCCVAQNQTNCRNSLILFGSPGRSARAMERARTRDQECRMCSWIRCLDPPDGIGAEPNHFLWIKALDRLH